MPTYTARWVLPVAGPPLEGGLLTVAGDRIAAVEPAGTRSPDFDLGNVALVPGFVNAHCHLDLSGARGRTPPTDAAHFPDWLLSVIAFRRSRTPEQVQADIRAGLAELLASGTTVVGDITAGGASWDALAAAPLRATVFLELIGLRDEGLAPAFAAVQHWRIDREHHPRCRPGVSPHAPYSARRQLYGLAGELGLPVCTHWAESPAEVELIEAHAGKFVDFLKLLGVWDERQLAFGYPHLLDVAGRGGRVLLAHANYPTAADLSRAAVVYCPRTHAAFGHPPHPFRDYLAAGAGVCLGTDGLSSNPDLDVLSEARFVAERCPDFSKLLLLRMLTLSGAEALGRADECGSLVAGKSADFVAVPLPERDGDPHALLFAEDRGERMTWFRGERRGMG